MRQTRFPLEKLREERITNRRHKGKSTVQTTLCARAGRKENTNRAGGAGRASGDGSAGDADTVTRRDDQQLSETDTVLLAGLFTNLLHRNLSLVFRKIARQVRKL